MARKAKQEIHTISKAELAENYRQRVSEYESLGARDHQWLAEHAQA